MIRQHEMSQNVSRSTEKVGTSILKIGRKKKHENFQFQNSSSKSQIIDFIDKMMNNWNENELLLALMDSHGLLNAPYLTLSTYNLKVSTKETS